MLYFLFLSCAVTWIVWNPACTRTQEAGATNRELGMKAQEQLSIPTARPAVTDCLGTEPAKGHLIYLHGLRPADRGTAEEGGNREVLEQLARELSLRVAIPLGPLCASGQRCWPAADKNEVLKTFEAIREQARSCWSGNPGYNLLGFSNGGYFALKLYKVHQDPQLLRILATGSAGYWDAKIDQPHPTSRFFLMMGRRDMTLKKATQLASTLRRVIPGFRFETFVDGHKLDYLTTKLLLESR